MKKCIIYGLGQDYDTYINAVKYQEILKKIKVVGVTSEQTIYNKVDNYLFIDKTEFLKCDFDILLVADTKRFAEIRREMIMEGIDDNKIINIKVFGLPDFDIDKYIKIKNAPLSIISNCCWGGLTYNRLGLQFCSPFVNMYESDWDYIKILRDLKFYLTSEAEFLEWCQVKAQEGQREHKYPVARLADARLYFNHSRVYVNDDEKQIWMDTKEMWERRVLRVNWDNLFIMMYTEDIDIAMQFAELPYENKVCFVPFELKEESLFYVDYCDKNEMCEEPFWKIVNGMANGTYKYYDVLKLLCGQINKSRII